MYTTPEQYYNYNKEGPGGGHGALQHGEGDLDGAPMLISISVYTVINLVN